jgi:hypothetical protein
MLAALLLFTTVGCSPAPDERLARFAQDSIQAQKEQNQMLARQSEATIQENQRVVEASQSLVEKDTAARHDMIAAQRELGELWQAERSRLDRERCKLETERREIAAERRRDSVLAEAIGSVGTLLVSVIPLVLVAYAMWRLDRGPRDSGDLNELLVTELAGDGRRLLGTSSEPAESEPQTACSALSRRSLPLGEPEEQELPF